ncbi:MULTISPECIES: hypothetical protein [Streptomyces]|uniref:hypothetical protein n=1 Tax=Streptomyces TaxID=1883 RepID=UPI000FB51329|nr:hypothetical protein [Streptomyces sp. WAC08452]RSS28411.1 hypothetical protein EF916_17725 [Streptomyces sp. WAC08452]
MTPSLRTAHACRAAAVVLLVAAGYAATHHPWLALPGLYAAAVFTWCAARARTEHRLRWARAQRAERLARPRVPLLPPAPCCAFWRHSGAAHGPECTRPAAARLAREGCCERWWTSLGEAHDPGCGRLSGSRGQDQARTGP